MFKRKKKVEDQVAHATPLVETPEEPFVEPVEAPPEAPNDTKVVYLTEDEKAALRGLQSHLREVYRKSSGVETRLELQKGMGVLGKCCE